MPIQHAIYVGLDVGTQGIKALALNDAGEAVASANAAFPLSASSRREQSPRMWWDSAVECLQSTARTLKDLGQLKNVKAISVTSTSGTLIPLDASGEPLHDALMYSDDRQSAAADRCNEALLAEQPSAAFRYNASYGLPKIVWFMEQYPDKAMHIRYWVHAGDYLLGKLSGVWGTTDYTNSLKTGYDLIAERWPDYIASRLGVPASALPDVVRPGFRLGTLSAEAAGLTGLPAEMQVAAGMTDGCASQLASGCRRTGDWNTTIGTTLVVKGITRKPIRDPLGRFYNHRHPDGLWMPGGASNTGADWISRHYGREELGELNAYAARHTPSPWLSYPLLQQGERFPFLHAPARGFHTRALDRRQLFTASMEGVAFIERLSYDIASALSGEPLRGLYTSGGGSSSETWLSIRSRVLQVPIHLAAYPEGAAGAAVIAAASCEYGSLSEAAAQLIRIARVFEPDARPNGYEERYLAFLDELNRRGYVKTNETKSNETKTNETMSGGEQPGDNAVFTEAWGDGVEFGR